jgi:hypothetical protein
VPKKDEPPEKRPVGQPPRVPGAVADKKVTVRVTDDEHAAWTRAAKRAKARNLSAWIISTCNAAVKS